MPAPCVLHRAAPLALLGCLQAAFGAAALPAQRTPTAPPACGADAPDAAQRIARITSRLYPAVLLRSDTATRTLEARMRALNVPGVQLAVIDGDRIAWSRGFGMRDVDSRQPVTTATRFQAASLSKPIATLGVLALVSQGRLGLDDDVRRHLRAVPLTPTPFLDSGTVTPRLLLSHRAGVSVSGFLGYSQTDTVPTLAQVIRGARPANHPALEVRAVPGRDPRYSGGGYTIMEQVMEEVARTPFVPLLQREVLGPLGMARSTYATLSPAAPDDIARGHTESGAIVPGGWRTHPEHAAASLWTTACDYARAILAMQRAARGERSPLDAALVREMFTLQAPSQGVGVGLKGAPVPFRFSHTGSNVGYRAIMMGFLDAPRGLVVLTNGARGDELMNELVRAVAEEYGWNDMRPAIRTTVALDSAAAAPLVGRYEVTPERAFVLTWRDGSLWAAPAGRAPQRMHAIDDGSLGFFFDAELLIWPQRDASGGVTGIRWGTAGNSIMARKVPSTP